MGTAIHGHFEARNMAVGQNQWYHFGLGEFTHFRTYFSGWIGSCSLGANRDFDPWPYGSTPILKRSFASSPEESVSSIAGALRRAAELFQEEPAKAGPRHAGRRVFCCVLCVCVCVCFLFFALIQKESQLNAVDGRDAAPSEKPNRMIFHCKYQHAMAATMVSKWCRNSSTHSSFDGPF